MNPSAAVDARRWIVCQIGARENYAVARALHRHGALEALITDAWVAPVPGLRRVAPRLAARYQGDLSNATIRAPTIEAILRESWDAAQSDRSFERIIRRNEWFQRKAVASLQKIAARTNGVPITVFAYSYAAAEILRFAKRQGWRAVLGQIDPGPVEDRLVKRLHDEHPAGAASHVAKPDSYWTSWREETQLADMIVVNSEWSRGALVQEGVAADKMKVVPLAYEPPADALAHEIHAPERFTEARPMRALFLGQVILRKGVYPLLEAIRGLRDEPIEFHFVGPRTIPVDDDVRHSRKVIWHGPIPRDEIGRFYEQADVFLFPTLSDGFGLTQLEALAWGVPVLASKHCGAAVVDGVNGVVLPEVTPGHIEAALRRLLADPSLVRDLGAGARRTRVPGLDDLFFKIAGSSTP